ncbi:MAG: hypothetical protein KIS79_04230 [Burkholderiales bacterium]|nr:hypothetical protein [Burkholderiales bacterium]
MDALHVALRKIHADPTHPTSVTLQTLIESLDNGTQFDLGQLYALNYGDFGLAMDLIRQWRLDAYRYERGWASQAARDTAIAQMPVWTTG